MDFKPQVLTNVSSEEGLQLCPITVDKEYSKKWNLGSYSDFLILCKDGVPLREVLYRLGGLNYNLDLKKDKYFMLLKHTEAFYPDDITKDPLGKPHLRSTWTILDSNGNERYEHAGYGHPYLLDKGPIYSVDKKYYHIETGEYFGEASGTISSDEYLFLNNPYAKDPNKRGVMKIHKQTGKWELFPTTGSTGWKE